MSGWFGLGGAGVSVPLYIVGQRKELKEDDCLLTPTP